MKLKLFLLITIISLSSCKREKENIILVNELPGSSWNCKYVPNQKKKGVAQMDLDSVTKKKMSEYWPILLTESKLNFYNNTYTFKSRLYTLSGKWGKKNNETIWLLGDGDIFNDTITAKFEHMENEIFLRISETAIIDLNVKDKIEFFGSRNTLFELEKIDK